MEIAIWTGKHKTSSLVDGRDGHRTQPVNSEIEKAFGEADFFWPVARSKTQPVNSEIEKAFAERLTFFWPVAPSKTQPVNSEIEKAFAEQKPTFARIRSGVQVKIG